MSKVSPGIPTVKCENSSCCKTTCQRVKVCKSFTVLFLSLCMIALEKWVIDYAGWKTQPDGLAGSSIMVTFRNHERCPGGGGITFASEVLSISKLGGGTDTWESVVALGDSLSEKLVLVTDGNEERYYNAVEKRFVFWIPNPLLRVLSLNTLSRIQQTLAVYVKLGDTPENCTEWFQFSDAANVALLQYIMVQSGEYDLALFNADLNGTWYQKEWICDSQAYSSIRPSSMCKADSDGREFEGSYYAFLVLWGLIIVLSEGAFIALARSFFFGNVKLVEVPSKKKVMPSPSTAGSNSASVQTFGGIPNGFQANDHSTAETQTNENEDKTKLRTEVNTFVKVFNLLFVVNEGSNVLDHQSLCGNGTCQIGFGRSQSEASMQIAILLLPIVTPAMAAMLSGCEIHEDECMRKQEIQMPIFFLTLAYTILAVGFLLGSTWNIFPGNIYRYTLRFFVGVLCIISVAMIATNFLWMIVACTVRPWTAGTKIVAILSIAIYVVQTWRKLTRYQQEAVKRLTDAKLSAEEVERELLKHGIDKSSLVSFMWISTSIMVFLFLWLMICAVIFYSDKSESESPFFSFLFAFAFPVGSTLMHIFTTTRAKANANSMSPVSDLLENAGKAAENSKLSEALKHIHDEVDAFGSGQLPHSQAGNASIPMKW